jgi:hypothetical protein
MRKNALFFFFTIGFLLIGFLMANAVEVTFRVDMSEQTVSPDGVHIAGTFQGWDPSATQMTLSQDNIYVYTADFTEGEALEYKFVNGNAWGLDEQVPAGCALNGNRFLTVPAESIVLEAVCFGSCNVCNPPEVEITFQVDMSNETVSPNGIHIAGSFQDPPWQPGATEMQPIGDDIYAVTLFVGSGDYHEYKFINGNAWGFDETVPQECANGLNRFITIPDVPTTLDALCFGSCYPCGPPPVDISVTFQVDMSEQEISPNGVHIAGGFQGWDPGATLMTDVGDNIFAYTTILPSGTYQEYKFINGTTWDESENVPPECGVNNNRYFTVPDEDITLDVVCYAGCGPCGPPPVEVMVTFVVDMENEEVSADGVHLAGTFQDWNPETLPMENVSEDIYQVTVAILSGTYIEYKFINGISFDFAETVPEECGVDDGFGGFSRYYTIPDMNVTLDEVCFGSCDPCSVLMPDHEVIFRVDMSNEDVSPDGVHLAGSFQGWDPAANPMTLTGNNIFETTILLTEGSTYEYKFINGNTFVGAETVPPDCAQNGNRYFTVPDENITLDLVCFGSCDPCGPPPTNVEVTFQVDLEFQEISPLGVHLAGSFQGWDPGATEMTNIGETIFAVTITLQSGAYHEFKFVNGNEWDMDESVPEECSNNNNRYITVPQNDTTLDAVCFNYCISCDLVGNVDQISVLTEFNFFPNPANEIIYFSNASRVSVFSVTGNLMLDKLVSDNKIDISSLKSGLYYLMIKNDKGSLYRKLIIE